MKATYGQDWTQQHVSLWQRREAPNQAAEPYPWESPEADLAAAEKLIIDCGYHRHDEELADAKRAILGA